MRDVTRGVGKTLLVAGIVLAPQVSFAGTGRLVSSWMSRAPQVDGYFNEAEGEWREAITLDLGQGVSARVGNDGRTLYLAVIDPRANVPFLNRAILFFEDEGGAPPQLDDDLWTSGACQFNPALGEGEIWFDFSLSKVTTVNFYEWMSDGETPSYCPAQPVENRMRSASQYSGGRMIFEIALPLDGPGPIHASPGQRLGFELRALDNTGGNDACYPACVIDPPSFRNLILASGGCNTGPQDLGASNPPPEFPLDWTSATSPLSQGWVTARFDDDPWDCTGNATGGSGNAACVANVGYIASLGSALLRIPLSVAAQAAATVRFSAVFEKGEFDDFFQIETIQQDQTFAILETWQTSRAAQRVEFNLDLTVPPYQGNPPVELRFYHYTDIAGGVAGGFAQIDDVELLCGPVLFADGFDSGLSTHWSATVP